MYAAAANKYLQLSLIAAGTLKRTITRSLQISVWLLLVFSVHDFLVPTSIVIIYVEISSRKPWHTGKSTYYTGEQAGAGALQSFVQARADLPDKYDGADGDDGGGGLDAEVCEEGAATPCHCLIGDTLHKTGQKLDDINLSMVRVTPSSSDKRQR